MSIKINKPLPTGNLEADKAIQTVDLETRKLNNEVQKVETETNAEITKTNVEVTRIDTEKLAIANIDDTPANDADTAVSSKWLFDNLKSFSSSWAQPPSNDWTDATITITHNLGVHLPYLICKAFWSASGADGADNYEISPVIMYRDVSGNNYGSTFKGVDADNVGWQTGANGAIYLNATGVWALISSGYYKVKIYYLNL